MTARAALWIIVCKTSARTRTIGNAQARTIRNARPVLSGTLTPRKVGILNAESAPSNYPNIKNLTFFLTGEVCGYRSPPARGRLGMAPERGTP